MKKNVHNGAHSSVHKINITYPPLFREHLSVEPAGYPYTMESRGLPFALYYVQHAPLYEDAAELSTPDRLGK